MPPSEHLEYLHDGEIDLAAGENTLHFKLEDVSPKATEQIIVKAATLELTPVFGSMVVDATIDSKKADWGIVVHPSSTDQTFWACADLGSPRTITAIGFTGSVGATLQIDVGGTFMAIAQDGTLCIPSDRKDAAPLLTLSPANGAVPLLTTSKIKLTAVSSSDKSTVDSSSTLTVKSISFQPLPTNLNVKLPGQPPFWSHPGQLTASTATPDFSQLLAQFFAESQSSSNQDAYSIPITVHSDVIARLSSATLDIVYQIEQSLLPIGVPELKLTYGVHCFPQENGKAYRLSASLPTNATLLKARATIRGEFEHSRLVGCEGSPWATPAELPVHSPIVVELLPGQALAQPFCLAQPSPLERPVRVHITAIDLSAASKVLPASILNLALQSDADGRPSGEVLLSASVTVDPADLLDDTAALVTASAATEPALLPWISVPLPQPFVLEGSQRYWLVLQVQEGAAIWHCRPEPSSQVPQPSSQNEVRSLHLSRDNGFSWRIAKAQQQEALSAAMRLRHCPKTYRVPLCLRIGTGDTAQDFALDQFSALGKVDFSFDFLGDESAGLMAYWKAAGGGSDQVKSAAITIPLAFLSEAPGKLSIEEMSITYSLTPHENPAEDA